ncbi:MAG: V-type ATPase subunit [Clostridiales bacterium]|nr:V-type ATPase subunit [Clostridiales bacterium]
MARVKEADYLYLSTRIKAMSKALMPYSRLSAMAGADSGNEALKVLAEEGWEAFDPGDLRALESRIDAKRSETLAFLLRYAPDRRVVDLFRLKYDYHNIKALVKSAVLGSDESTLYTEAGTVSLDALPGALASGEGISPVMKEAYDRALAVLREQGDPQRSDMILDAALYSQMLAMARSMRSTFLAGYTRLAIDAGNLRSFVRLVRLYPSHEVQAGTQAGTQAGAQAGAQTDASRDFLAAALIDGGDVSKKYILSQNRTPKEVIALFEPALKDACREAQLALEGQTLTALDKACDNTLIAYMGAAHKSLYGQAHIASFLYAKEQEFTAIRTVMTCFKYGLNQAEILEKLRYSYV